MSRNQREGRYGGKWQGRKRRFKQPTMWLILPASIWIEVCETESTHAKYLYETLS